MLEDSSVHHNEQLKEVILPDTVVAINKDALSHCYALEHIDLPPNLEYLGVSAFLFCTSLKEIVLPASLKWIGIDAFRYDEALTSITCLAPTPPSGEDGMLWHHIRGLFHTGVCRYCRRVLWGMGLHRHGCSRLC